MDMSTKTAGNYVVYRDGARVAAFALEEDMRLFAAAPSLLALVEMLDEWVDAEEAGDLIDMSSIRLAIRETIAEATGKEG